MWTKVDMAIMLGAAGTCGLIEAEEIKVMLEKSADVRDCWLHAANKTPHAAVSEFSYSFNHDHKGNSFIFLTSLAKTSCSMMLRDIL